MADAQPAPPPGLRPMRPIKRVPFIEEDLPLAGPPLTDPNDRPFASAPPAAAASAGPAAAAPSFTPSFVAGAAGTPGLTAPAASVPSFASTLASVAPAAAALVSSPSAAGALNVVAPALGALAPALGGAGAVVSKIASEAPAVEALIKSPSAAAALGVAVPTLSAAAPDVAQYANPLLQTVASRDLNAPFGAMADRVAGIGQSHPAEDAQVRGMLQNLATNMLTKKGIEAALNKVTTGEFLGAAGSPAALAAGVVVNALKSKPAY